MHIKDMETYSDFSQFLAENRLNNSTVSWTIGGMSGGNCWGDQPYPATAEEEPDETEIDVILETVFPDITYLEYRKVVRDIFEYSRREDREYYGNYSIVKIRTIRYETLYANLRQAYENRS